MHTIKYPHLAPANNQTWLDLGCGEGRHCIGACDLKSPITVIGVDLSLNDLARAKNKWQETNDFHKQLNLPELQTSHWLNGNGAQLPFSDHSFDVVICSEVLEHIHDYLSVMKEIRRVLKPNGKLAISIPKRWPEWICWQLAEEYAQVEGGHVRIFNHVTLKREIRELGFHLYKSHSAHALHAPYWWLKCAFWHAPDHPLVKKYHDFLVWDLMEKPKITRALETLLNPWMGKSSVYYFEKLSPESRTT
jgi:SAM-dependent methyltransferase